MQFGRDAERLHAWLVNDMGCNASSMTRGKTAQQIADRVLIKGFKCEIKLSEDVIKSSHSHFGDDKKRAFMNQKLTGNLNDFTGIGPASLANLAAVGITNSDGLFAAFLSIIDNPIPMANTDKCDQFYEQLGRYGVASGYKATIIYQLQSKLAVGIDSSNVGIENCQQLDAIPEHSSPRTGEQSRALPPGAGPRQTGRELFPSLDTEQAREAKQLAEKAEAIRLQQEALVRRREVERVRVENEGKQLEADALAIRLQQEALVRRREADGLAFRQRTGGERTGRQLHFPPDQQARHHIASAGSMSAYAIPVALLAFVLAYLYWPLRLVALVVAYMYWRNSR